MSQDLSITKILRKIAIPNDFLGFIRLVVSALALIALLKHAFQYSPSKALELLIGSYEKAIETVFSPLEPFVAKLADVITSMTSLSLTLDGTWRYVFLILGIYFFGRVRSALQFGYWGTAFFRFFWGAAIAITASVVIASATLSVGSFYENLALATMCVGAVLVYELGVNFWFATFFRQQQAKLHNRRARTWIEEFIRLSESDLARGMIAVLIATSVVFFAPLGGPKSAGITAFAIVMLIYGIFWLYWASRQLGSVKRVLIDQEKKRNSDADIGFSILGIYFWTLVLVAVDAGIRVMSP